MKKTLLFLISLLIFSISGNYIANAQIDDIKDKSNKNKDDKNNNDNNNNNNDNPGSDIAGSCISGCVDIGCNVGIAFIGAYTAELFETKPDDPEILSLDLNGNFALGYHYSKDTSYTYVNYLPGFRAKLVSFIIDFKYNILTEYTDDFPNSFKSWHLDVAFNIVPSPDFKIAIGTGVQREQFSNSYFHEYFLCSKIGLSENTDYIDIDLRASVDYETEVFPFFETGIFFNKRMIDFEHLAGYISLGGLYQNYYQSHDIWALRGGIIFNWH